MTTPNQYPTPEDAPLNQRFVGEIIPEYTKDGLSTVITPMLRAGIGKSDSLVIDAGAEAPRLGEFYGAPVVATLELGGAQNLRAEKVRIARVDPSNQEKRLRSFLSYAEEDILPDRKPFYVVAVGDATISGFTVVTPTTRSGLFGRKANNLSWFDAYGKPYQHGADTEVIHNGSVSRAQLYLSYDETGGLRINGHTDHSDTVVTTVATEEHQRIVEKNGAAKEAVSQAAKITKTGTRIRGLLSRRR